MHEVLSHADVALLCRLIVAHLVADFVIQKRSWVEHRSTKGWASPALYVHGLVAGVLAYVAAGYWSQVWLLFVIVVSHVLLDGFKAGIGVSLKAFVLDQAGHFAVILVCWCVLVGVGASEVGGSMAALSSDARFWIVALSYAAILWPAGVLVGIITQPWRAQGAGTTPEGLQKAGTWIGFLERILILTFILAEQSQAIGFLIAAKSLFRFGGPSSPDGRRQTEYFLIGTLTSFAVAIVVGMLARWWLRAL
jgi:hypothetical protein